MTKFEGCLCGSGEAGADCCAALLAGTSSAKTPEALMRSRYTAHVLGDVDYIARTTLPELRAGLDLAAIREWSAGSTWVGLEVLRVEAGRSEEEGFVEFRASYELGGVREEHRERSRFERREGTWYFDSRAPNLSEGQVRSVGRTGRNELCPCGSGKKYKKCCGC